MDTLGRIFHVNFLGYAYLFIPIRISQMKYHSISLYQARYATSIVEKYLDTATVEASTRLYKTNFPYNIIFTKADSYTSGEKVKKLTRLLNIHYRYCIVPLIYFLSTIVDLSFELQKLAKFS